MVKEMFKKAARGVVAVGAWVKSVAKPAVTATVTVLGVAMASAQTDATVIATNASSAFGVIAPITITIAGFYVILTIAKRVVH